MKKNKIGIVSYPKSGNTWLRFILANIFYPQEIIDYKNINSFIPTSTNQSSQKNKFNIEFYKSHKSIDQSSFKKFNKIIYITRNGYKVANSYYAFIKAQNPLLIDNEKEFLRIHSAYYGSWGNHIKKAMSNDNKNLLIVSYEHLILDPFEGLNKILNFLNIKILKSEILRAVDNCSKENMSKLKGSANFINSKNFKTNYNFADKNKRKNISDESISIWNSIGNNYLLMKNLYNLQEEKKKRNIFFHGIFFKWFYLLRLNFRKKI